MASTTEATTTQFIKQSNSNVTYTELTIHAPISK